MRILSVLTGGGSSLDRYIAKKFLTIFLQVLFILTSTLLLMDLLGRSTEILSADGATWHALLVLVGLRLPQLISQYLPFSVLIAGLLCQYTLAKSSELQVIRAAGISTLQFIRPLLLCSLFIAILHGLLHNNLTVGSIYRLSQWQENHYQGLPPSTDSGHHNVWVSLGDYILKAKQISRSDSLYNLLEVTLYHYDANGLVYERISAVSATIAKNDEWDLSDAEIFNANTLVLTHQKHLVWHPDIGGSQVYSSSMVAEQADVGELLKTLMINNLSNGEIQERKAEILHRFTLPLSSLVMIFISTLAGFSSGRKVNGSLRIGVGLLAGFVFFVADKTMFTMARLDMINIALGLSLPMVLFLFFSLIVINAEESHFFSRMFRNTDAG